MFSDGNTYNLIGASHRTLPVDQRELLAKIEKDSNSFLRSVVAECRLKEVALLSTCNRFEIISVGTDAEKEILRYLTERFGAIKNESFYALKNSDAIRHVFRVAASLDSLVVGEQQILGQVKDSYAAAVKNGFAGPHLHHLFQFAFSIAKRIRTRTELAKRSISVSYVAVKLAEQIFDDLSKRSVLIVGSGRMAELAALHLKSRGCKRIIVCNRTLSKASELAQLVSGSALSLEDMSTALAEVDIAIGSIRCDEPMVTRDVLRKVKHKSPLFFIDLGVPRNFAADLDKEESVYLYNIDDLSQIAEKNRSVRDEASREAELIIEYGLLQYERWLIKRSMDATIIDLRAKIKEICRDEILSGVERSDELKRSTDHISHRISQKIAHELTELLETSNGKIDAQYLVPLLMDTKDDDD